MATFPTGLPLKRNELIAAAYRKLGIGVSAELTQAQFASAIRVLNDIIQEEAGGARPTLWATSEAALILAANRARYDTAFSGVAQTVEEIHSVVFRTTAGDDRVLISLSDAGYATIADKNSTGDPTHYYFKPHILYATTPLTTAPTGRGRQEIWVWPVPTAVGTSSQVVGTDGLQYDCVMGHTAAAQNKPTTGSDWATYWQLARGLDRTALTAMVWATATAYTNAKLLRYTFRRPLAEMNDAGDNPDMPVAYNRYLIYRLAFDLSPEYAIAIDERDWLQTQWRQAQQDIFPSIRPKTTDFHDKILYY